MSEASPSFSELIARALESRVAEVNVSMPGQVVSYDPATQTATVRPCLQRVVFDEDDEPGSETLPDLTNVPVAHYGGASLTVHTVLAAGDTGTLVFSTNSFNEWQANGNVSTPGDLKLHGIGCATFIPGTRHKRNAAPDTDDSIGKPGGLRLHFEEGAIKAGLGAQFVALAALVDARFSAIESWAASHTHVCAAPASPSATALPPLAPGSSTASSNLKADP